MPKVPFTERVERFLMYHGARQGYIPIHPNDIEEALKDANYERYEYPYRPLCSTGSFGGKGSLDGY